MHSAAVGQQVSNYKITLASFAGADRVVLVQKNYVWATTAAAEAIHCPTEGGVQLMAILCN